MYIFNPTPTARVFFNLEAQKDVYSFDNLDDLFEIFGKMADPHLIVPRSILSGSMQPNENYSIALLSEYTSSGKGEIVGNYSAPQVQLGTIALVK